MYLKNIEIQGFKSFARKIVFEFHEGITGIVGPNGSGKSNVADAVRWVFGEQKVKQLRGGSMQDVIFAGTELRKPLSYASVSITLDNSDRQLAIDFEEVTITRKLFRSGESEYSINGSTCRLKDINELFYDTGIGKEGYSIIGQGQIDKILSGRPEERRELFDEAAGIVKFKKRKNIAVKKLDDERQNLIRLNDILSELEKQVGPLEKQSNIAKEYLDMKQELKVYDINMFLLENEKYKKQLTELDEKIGIAQSEYKNTNDLYDTMKAEYEKAEHEIDEIQDAIEKHKQQLNETQSLKQQLEGRIAVLEEQINTVKTTDEHIDQRVLTIQSDILERNTSKDKLEKELLDISAHLNKEKEKAELANTHLKEVQDEINVITTFVDQKKQTIIELLTDRTSTQGKIQRFEAMLEQGQLRKNQINDRETDLQVEKENFEKQLSEQYQNQNEVNQTLASYQSEITSLEEDIKETQNGLDQKGAQLREKQTEYHREHSRLESLRNITERYDGYGMSIRKVMEKKSQIPGLLGVVADIVKTQKKYEIAIETALGGSLQNIVTDNENTAKQMVQYLKQNKLGRATFLPLTSMRASQGIRQAEVLKEKGVLGVASSLVQVDDKYTKLSDQLLGRTIVAEDIDIGIALGRKYQNNLRIVTLEGELLNPGGAITGGAFKNSSNLLGRRREIKDLETKVSTLSDNLMTVENEIIKEKEHRSTLYQEIDVTKVKLQETSMHKNTSEMKVAQLENKLQEISHTLEEISNEYMELEEQNKNITEGIQGIQSEINTSDTTEKSANLSIQNANIELAELKTKEAKVLQHNETMHLSIASTEQSYNFTKENFQRIELELHKLQVELEDLNNNKGSANQEIQDKLDEITDIRNTIKDSEELFVEIEAAIQTSTSEKEALSQKHKNLIVKREEISKQILDLDKEIFRLDNKKETYETELDKSIDYMWNEYEITYNYALELRNPNLVNLETMKTSIKELKDKIKKLGNVNVNAIEEYKSVAERYHFMKTQHDDLIEAEGTLLQIIEELDVAMREQFKNQFALINEEYNKVFKQLFGGGKGTIELMENEDVLEAGIKIIAQPPGKKLQNMMQLSGGEKALTAISLLFAIQNLKPSPFCLLDEIEAALDDSNVVRFAEYLHKLTKNTQFIVITHRRGTMTASDRLYGITMQEKGVSTLVSVDLLQDELEE